MYSNLLESINIEIPAFDFWTRLRLTNSLFLSTGFRKRQSIDLNNLYLINTEANLFNVLCYQLSYRDSQLEYLNSFVVYSRKKKRIKESLTPKFPELQNSVTRKLGSVPYGQKVCCTVQYCTYPVRSVTSISLHQPLVIPLPSIL